MNLWKMIRWCSANKGTECIWVRWSWFTRGRQDRWHVGHEPTVAESSCFSDDANLAFKSPVYGAGMLNMIYTIVEVLELL